MFKGIIEFKRDMRNLKIFIGNTAQTNESSFHVFLPTYFLVGCRTWLLFARGKLQQSLLNEDDTYNFQDTFS